MLLDPITATSSSMVKCLECRPGGPVEVDPDAGAEQRLVVGALRVVHHALVADFGHEELDAEAPGSGSDDGHQDGFVRHEVRTGDADTAFRFVDERGIELQVVVIVEAGAAGQHLCVDDRRPRVDGLGAGASSGSSTPFRCTSRSRTPHPARGQRGLQYASSARAT